MDSTHQQTKRTCGDGMETNSGSPTANVDPKTLSNSAFLSKLKSLHEKEKTINHDVTEGSTKDTIPGRHLIYRQPDEYNFNPPAVQPHGKIFALIPRLITATTTKAPNLNTREPRFIPMEPYKAAISPLVAPKRRTKSKPNRNNLDLNVLVSHISDIRCSVSSKDGCDDEELTNFERERHRLQKEIDELKRGKQMAEIQLKSQVQVNAELKHLLVAAIGEDLQTRVNVLTEDKLQLAQKLLSTAQNLSTHTEQIEYLAGQSEVWRSKFLASSVMVEELARWKASLLQKNQLLLKSSKCMLETLATIRDMEIETLKNLKFMGQIRTLNLPSSNVLDITAECLNISQQLILHSGIGMPSNLDLNGLDTTTDAEKLTIEALQNVNEPLMSTDEAFKAIVSQAFLPNCIENATNQQQQQQQPSEN